MTNTETIHTASEIATIDRQNSVGVAWIDGGTECWEVVDFAQDNAIPGAPGPDDQFTLVFASDGWVCDTHATIAGEQ